jgi:hypothetical protein
MMNSPENEFDADVTMQKLLLLEGIGSTRKPWKKATQDFSVETRTNENPHPYYGT